MTTASTFKLVNGTYRNDAIVYDATQSAGTKVKIDGQWGCDTLSLVFTRDQWMSSALQTDLAQLRAYLGGYHKFCTFEFKSLGLKIEDIEKVRIVVDGRELSLADDGVCAVNDAYTVLENASVKASVVDNDIVPDLVRNVALLTKPAAGTLDFRADGSFTFTAGDSFDYLRAGEKTTVCFTYKVTDADGDSSVATVTLTVVGTNDVAIIGQPTVSVVTEDMTVVNGLLSAAGKIAITDADRSEAAFRTTVSGAGDNLGTLTLKADGSYVYGVDNAKVQYLGAGQTKVDTFTVTALDGTTKTVTFTVNGVNDAAVIGAPTVTVVTEDAGAVNGLLTATGMLAITDADRGEAAFRTTVSGVGDNLGTLTLKGDGSYVYGVDNAKVQDLGAGQTKVDTFTVTSLDGTTKTVTFTVNGANDVAVIGTPTVSAVTEDAGVVNGLLTATGMIAITDVDRGEAAFRTTVSGAGDNLGTLTLKADGSYVYGVDNAKVQSLGAGQTKVDTFTVTSLDGTTKAVAFTVNGANDAAVIGTPTVSAVTEDSGVVNGLLTATGTLAITDVDQGEAAFRTAVSAAGDNLGALTLKADGSYVYGVENAKVQSLGADHTKVDTFTVTSLDGTTKTVAFTINGVNDAPIAKDDAFKVSETGAIVVDVLANDSDVDGNPLTVEILSQPIEGKVSLDADGHVVFDPGLDFYRLSAGQNAEVSFDYRVLDGFGGTSTAKATVLVEGSGLFVSPTQTGTGTTVLPNGQSATLTLGGPTQAGFVDGHIDIDLTLGPIAGNKKNIFYVVDISGSTNTKFGGTPVGDLNGKGGANTILDAEIDGLLKLNKAITALGYSPDDVTVTVAPFNSKADPADWVSNGPTPNIKTMTYDVGSTSIDGFLRSLDNGGGTNYEEALQAVIDRLKVLDPNKTEGNYVYFLSDGAPNPVNGFGDEIATLQTDYHAQMSAIGLGPTVPLQYLDMIDNTGGAERVVSTDELTTALLTPPIKRASVSDFDVFVNGVQLGTITAKDLIETPFGLSLDLDVTGLRPILGNANQVEAVVEFDDHTKLAAQIKIGGVLPVSTFDFIV
jgi:VCBS repeat-containing protein